MTEAGKKIFDMSIEGLSAHDIYPKVNLTLGQVEHRQSLMAVDVKNLAFEAVIKAFGQIPNFENLVAGYINEDFRNTKPYEDIIKVTVYEDAHDCRQRHFNKPEVGRCIAVSYKYLYDLLKESTPNGSVYRVAFKKSARYR